MFWRRKRPQSDFSEELQAHLTLEIDRLREEGMSEEEASAMARRNLGNIAKAQERFYESHRWLWLDYLWQDVRYGLRQLRRNPGFTVVAVLTLALGIGANTAIFTVVNGVLLNPLPYPNANRLVALAERLRQFPEFAISYPDFLDWKKMNHSFTSLAAYRHTDLDLTGSGEAERVKVTQVSASFFPLLGVKPVIGRNFSPDEDRRGAAPVVILRGGFWKRKFGGSPEILGKALTLGGTAYTVIGIIPQSFYFCCENANFVLGDVYTPIGQYESPWMSDRGAHPGIFAIGRLKKGITLQQASADMEGIARDLASSYPDSDKDAGATLTPLRERMVSNVKPMLLILLAAVGFVLLIACANVANLFLARSTGRMREFAIRSVLGASRRRVIQQLLTESTLLALAGGGIGLLLASLGTKAGLAALPATLPRANEVRLDPHVLGFTLVASLFAGVIFGLAPALQSARPNLQESLKEGGRGSTSHRHRTQHIFVILEMAMAVVLLVGAGLTIRSLVRLWGVNPGFNPRNVLTFEVALPPSTAKEIPEQVRASIRRLTGTIRAVPGVKTAAITDGAFPMSGDSEVGFWAEGQPKPATQSEMPNAVNYIVGDDYFNVMKIPLLRGRLFTPQDTVNSQFVAVIDEDFARAYFPGQDPVGKILHLAGLNKPFEIVGVVGHVNQWGLDEDKRSPLVAQLYNPVTQIPDQFISFLAKTEGYVVRTQSPEYASAGSVRSAIEGMSRDEVAYGFESMDGIIGASLASRRFTMILLAVFAALAMALACIGIYGVISYFALQRTHEIGIRLALGARRSDVLKLVVGQGLKFTLTGVAIGIVGALGLTRFMASLLYAVRPTDPLTFAAVSFILLAVALLASYIPARRATKVDPMVALRHE
jgi:predicted permease